MTAHVFIIVTTAPDGEADAYDRWYVDRHMPDVLAIPGFVAAQRFRLAADPSAPDAAVRYLTLYEIETDEIAPVMAELRRRADSDQMPLYAGKEAGMLARFVGEAVTPRIEAAR